MRKIQLTSLIMSILSCLTIFSIGYSSWYEFKTVSASTNIGSFESYDVLTIGIDSDNDGQKIEADFQFSALSFKKISYTDNTLSEFIDTNSGKITVTYKVPKSSVEKTGGNFTIVAELGYSDAKASAKLFGEAFPNGSDVNYPNHFEVKYAQGKSIPENVATITTATIDSDTDRIVFSKDFSSVDTTTDFYFTVEYTLTVPKSTETDPFNFRNTFGKNLIGSEDENQTPTKFIPSAHLKAKISN